MSTRLPKPASCLWAPGVKSILAASGGASGMPLEGMPTKRVSEAPEPLPLAPHAGHGQSSSCPDKDKGTGKWYDSGCKVGLMMTLSCWLCRYVGKCEGLPPGYWVGVQLDEPVGKNDGRVKGRRYFECALGYGSFLRPDKVMAGDFPEIDEFRFSDEDEI